MEPTEESLLQITKIALVLRVTPLAQGRYEIHRNRPTHGLIQNVSGEKRYEFADGMHFSVRAQEIFLLPRGSTYRVTGVEPGPCYAINFDVSERKTRTPFVFEPRNPAAYLSAFREAEYAWRTRQEGYLLKCQEMLCRLLYQTVQERRPVAGGEQQRIEPALRRMREEYIHPPVRVEELAALCGMSAVTFRKLFRRQMGLTPVAYLRQMRIERACELLATRLYTVSQVAEMSGFGDPAVFCREFKRATGRTPSGAE